MENQTTKVSKETKEFLAGQTNLTYKQITKWFDNKNQRKDKKSRKLKFEQIILLKKYFDNENQQPCADEISKLSKLICEPETKIKKWFYRERLNIKLINSK